MELSDPVLIRQKIMDFLSRREHSRKEIINKLYRRVSSMELLEEEVEKLTKEGLLNDKRFAEQYVYSRENKGVGPKRIRNELRERGVQNTIIEQLLAEKDWSEIARKVLLKKTKTGLPEDRKQMLKLKKFLYYRGFEHSDIERAIKLLGLSSNL